MKRKVKEKYVDHSLGFPVTLLNVPMKRVRDEWVPDLPLNEYQQVVLWMLAHMPVSLSGKQVRFIRHWMEKTQQEFAEMLDVTHAAVSKWESKGHEATGMAKPTEVLIRLNMLTELPDETWERLAAPYASDDKPTSLKRLLEEIRGFDFQSRPEQDELTIPMNDLPRPGRLPLR